MTFNQMTYFHTIVEEGNMRQAAERLYIAQPSLSASIANLEKELGVRLFQRKHQRLLLTPEGEAFLQHTRKILREVEETKIHMDRLSSQRESMMRIGCISPLLREFFPQKMMRFLALSENRGVQFNINVEHTPELVRGLNNGIYDLLLCSWSEDAGVEQIPILSDPMVFISPADGEAPPRTWADIAVRPLIGYDKGSVMDRALMKIAAENGIELSFSHRAPNEEAIIALVEHAFGCAVIPRTDTIRHRRVRSFALPSGSYDRELYLTTRRDHLSYGAAARFIDFLTAETKGD